MNIRNTYFFKVVKRFSEPVRFVHIAIVDGVRFYKNTFYTRRNNRSKQNLRGEISFYTHALEKGFLHEDFRPLFGKTKILILLKLIHEYSRKGFSQEDRRFVGGVNILRKYIRAHKDIGLAEQVNYIQNEIEKYGQISNTTVGVSYLEKDRIIQQSRGNFESLVEARHSVREFSTVPLNLKKVEKAIEICERTPSVCNRQSWKIYVSTENKKKQILSIQGGINGLAHNVGAVAVITADYQMFGNITERNQAFVDGGLFAMSFLYALTEQGVAACALNTDFNLKTEKLLRNVVNIPNNEALIMVVAMGSYPDSVVVPVSERDTKQSFYVRVD